MADLNKIIDDLSSLTVVRASELSKQLEENGSTTATCSCSASRWSSSTSWKSIGFLYF